MGAPRIETTSMLTARGDGTAQRHRALADGSIVRIRQGAYADADEWRDAGWRDRAIGLARVVQARASVTLVFSHETAAAVHDLPVLRLPVLGRGEEVVHVTAASGSPRRTRHGIVWHQSELRPDEIALEDGLLVTSAARTALDLAASRGMAAGVIALDHLLHDDAEAEAEETLDALREDVERRRPFRGVRRVAAALEVANGRADTPLESLSLARFVEFGIPLPEQQILFRIPGHPDYFTDFFWRRWRMIGESDGRRKYEEDAERDGRDPRDVLWAEKRREDALRSVTRRFARWGWADALHGHRLVEIVRRVAAS